MKKKGKILLTGIVFILIFISQQFDLKDVQTNKDSIPDNVSTEVFLATTTQQETQKISNSDFVYYKVSQVVDGDTIKIEMDGSLKTIRLIGIDTPETVDPRKVIQCFGKEASDAAKKMLAGQYVRIETDPSQEKVDKYGRILAYVYRKDGLFYNKYMIEAGFAHEYTYKIPYKFQLDFEKAESVARKNLLGLWSAETCNGDTKQAAE